MVSMDWRDKSVLITGGTGSFGKRMTRLLLEDFHPQRLVIFSRDELKQHEMRAEGFDDECLRFFIGDVRDKDRLLRAMNGIDVVFHAAALKQVPTCEYNPIEAVLTNVEGQRNVIDAAIDSGVERVMTISTDKAVNPVNLYGATKLTAEKLAVQANSYSSPDGTKFSCSRYGNVVGSRGSVIPVFLKQRKTGRVSITDPRMTRFWITLAQGVRFVLDCTEQMHGGEVFIPKLPSMNIKDLATALAPNCEIDEMGIRAGEKLHEVLINEDEARQTVEMKSMFVIQPAHPWWDYENWKHGADLPDGFRYASDTNDQWLKAKDLQRLIDED
ncbi:MAG: UDP-N-acetylglucosamine 4,6-dehydratase/5-epimerase [Actinomycetota bacterium]|nr:UDP-N-acetylglucosamine 4,6-dehydratase/5-epimerase [Actinomycetota bacterium]